MQHRTNIFHDSFFWSSKNREVQSTVLQAGSYETANALVKRQIWANVVMKPSQTVSEIETVWYRTTFSVFLSTFSALALAYMSAVRYVMGNYNSYT